MRRNDLDLMVTASKMRVCGDCGSLFGDFVDGEYGNVDRVQRCTCPRIPKPAEPEPPWGFRDFNRAVELCACCAATLVTSGSRWSLLFCHACHTDVRAWNESGASYIPIGRHSIANGIVYTAMPGEPRGPDGHGIAADEFAEKLSGLFARLDHLSKWRPSKVRALLEALRCGTRVPDYLRAVESESGRCEAFLGLREHFS